MVRAPLMSKGIFRNLYSIHVTITMNILKLRLPTKTNLSHDQDGLNIAEIEQYNQIKYPPIII